MLSLYKKCTQPANKSAYKAGGVSPQSTTAARPFVAQPAPVPFIHRTSRNYHHDFAHFIRSLKGRFSSKDRYFYPQSTLPITTITMYIKNGKEGHQ